MTGKSYSTAILFQLMVAVSVSLARRPDFSVQTQDELMRLYNGTNCDRKCILGEKPKICYFKFDVHSSNSMGPECGKCREGIMKDCQNPGCIPVNGIERSLLAINQKIGSNKIVACQNDKIVVDVYNRIAGHSISIHWHGVLQEKTPWMDGVPMITQCPINTRTTFRYSFPALDSGTHWFHSHSGLQRADGIIGSLIIRQPDKIEPNRRLYDEDQAQHHLVMTDWTNLPADMFATGLRSTPLRVNSVLVDGRGTYTDPNTNKSTVAPLTVVYCERDKRYRFRLINAGNQNCPLEFCVKDHNLTVIATDSFSVKPRDISCLYTSPGERYDVVLHTTNNPKTSNGIIRIRAVGNCKNLRPLTHIKIKFVNGTVYQKSEDDASPVIDVPQNDYDTDYGHSLLPTLNEPLSKCDKSKNLCHVDLEYNGNDKIDCVEAAKQEADFAYFLNFSIKVPPISPPPPHHMLGGENKLIGQINGISYVSPPVPPLIQDDSRVEYCNATSKSSADSIQYCTHMIRLPKWKIVDIYYFDEATTAGAVAHPMHLHGMPSCVLDMGNKANIGSGGSLTSGIDRVPVVKDVVPVPSAGYARIRVSTCNPGFWFLHCHFEWHMHVGMRLIVKVGEKDEMVQAPKDFPKCGDYLKDINY